MTKAEREAVRLKMRAEAAAAKAAQDEAADEALLAAEQEHGIDRARLVATTAGPVVVRAPSAAQYAPFRSRMWSEGQPGKDLGNARVSAGDALIRAVLCYPALDRWAEMVGRYPAIADPVLKAVLDIAGIEGHAGE